MKLFLLTITSCVLGGCAGNPPSLLAYMYNSSDSCQFRNIEGKTMDEKVANMPSYCGAGSGRTTIYATQHQQPLGPAVGYVKTR